MDDLVTKALALARIGAKVFPVDRATRSPAIPYTEGGRGFYDGTLDFEVIATWFTGEYADSTKYGVGVWTGGSGLFVLDIDRGKKNGKNGFQSIKDAGLKDELGDTEKYKTASGGEHRIWQTDRDDLTPGADILHQGTRLEGVDIRAGGSYIVWWGDTVPATRDAFSADIPEWLTATAAVESNFTGEGFAGSVSDWLDSLPDDAMPSSRIATLMGRIPSGTFGHHEMTSLVWEVVRLGSERETGVKMALDAIRTAWLRDPYDTPKFRHDLNMAIKGAISKGGRVQHPIPAMAPLAASMSKASDLGIADKLKSVERSVSETSTEIEFSRARKEMFQACADGGLAPSGALGIVTGSKSFKNSKVSIESAWFGDGEPAYHDKIASATEDTDEPTESPLTVEEEEKALVSALAALADEFSFLTEDEQALLATKHYQWWGDEYLAWVEKQLKHFNKPYHVGAMWAALSVIASAWGKLPIAGAKATDVNLYINIQGMSSSGKTEAWGFGNGLIDAFHQATGDTPIIADIKKATALSVHRTLILRDGKPSLIYSDEVQSFFQDIKKTHWQGSILGDMSDYYGGNVPPKNTMNDKEISGKRAKTMLTAYFTGIAQQTLDAIDINMWTSGLFYRFIWGFGYPRVGGDFSMKMESPTASVSTQLDDWAKEFRRVGALQEVKWGEGRKVWWEEDAMKRIEQFGKQMDEATKKSMLYDDVFVAANGRFAISVQKVATIVALIEAEEKVTLRHVLIALSYAGPWHRSMVLAVSETGKDSFERDVEKCLTWVRRNAIRQVGKAAWIQRSAVMQTFRPSEIADRLLRQLTEEGRLIRSGDNYQLAEGL